MKAEHQKLQAKSFQWHWNSYPKARHTLWMNLNNAPNAIMGAQYKALGLLAGVPDMSLIAKPYGSFVGIEFKVGRDTQKEAQKAVQIAIESLGGYYIIINTFEQFKAIFDNEGFCDIKLLQLL
jgi:hypothetical protein